MNTHTADRYKEQMFVTSRNALDFCFQKVELSSLSLLGYSETGIYFILLNTKSNFLEKDMKGLILNGAEAYKKQPFVSFDVLNESMRAKVFFKKRRTLHDEIRGNQHKTLHSS